jgi:DNA-binding NarL/FixJ family response regulator
MHLCADSSSPVPPAVRVVVADDADGLRELVCLLLDLESDFTVVGRARDGREAVDVVADTGPDLVVMDVAMPVMDGFTAFSGVRAAAPAAKVVFFTAFGEHSVGDTVRALGADGLIEKNVAVETIADRLRSVCRLGPARPGVAAAL